MSMYNKSEKCFCVVVQFRRAAKKAFEQKWFLSMLNDKQETEFQLPVCKVC